MRYRGALEIGIGQTEAEPATTVVGLCYGIVTGVQILFPAGQAGLTYVQVWHHERQIWPTSPGEAFRGDDHMIEFHEEYPINEVPYEVELRGWAPTATIAHTVYVDISVEAPPVFRPEAGGNVPLPEGLVL